MTPVLVVALALCYRRHMKLQGLQKLLVWIPFVSGVMLLLLWGIYNPGNLTERFGTLSIWKHDPKIALVSFKFLSNYLDYFSPSFLFLKGDLNLRHHTGEAGELFLFTFPALLAGLVYALERRKEPLYQFCLLGFLLFPLAASLTIDYHHSLRTLNALPFVIILIICGFQRLWIWFSAQRSLVGLLLIVALFETGRFYSDYFGSYPARAHAWFIAGLPEAVQTALANKKTSLYYSRSVFADEGNFINEPDIYFLFFGQLDASIYRKAGAAGFGIYPLDGQRKPESGSIILARRAQEFLTSNWTQVLRDIPNALPSGSVLLEEIKTPASLTPLRTIAEGNTFRIYRVP